ncbi:MAG: prepilin-type N-terminal cleavage/methylation domain-containing protein [Burkholderiales bacterium]
MQPVRLAHVGPSRGFTLIELVVTLAILAVLAAAVLPVAETTVQRQREQELRLALREIRSAIDAYKRAFDEGRIARTANATGYPPTLAMLVEGVDDQRDPRRRKIYFLRRLPGDPMSPLPATDSAATWAKRSYASGPLEPKEGDDVYDVASRSQRVGLNGVPYAQW